MSNWDEIRRLASDLQRVQLGEAAKKLSEKNCVEVVGKLTALGLVSLVYTIDGREYVTRQHLTTEIKNECYGNKGRVSLVDLAQTLNIEYQTIEVRAQDIVKNDTSFIVSVGQLISRGYIESICEEVNLRLQEEGCLTITEVTKSFDLPSNLLSNNITERMGKSIKGIVDQDNPSLLYTEEYIQRQKSVIRGAMSGLTKVIPVSKILNELKLQPTLFFRLLEELVVEGSVRGVVSGGRRADSAVFVPNIYTQLLRTYTKRFFLENGYIEFGTLKKLGVSDFVEYTRDVVSAEDASGLVVLGSCALGRHLWEQILSNVEEKMTAQNWADISEFLPHEAASYEDKEWAANLIQKHHSDWNICSDSFLYQSGIVAKCERLFDAVIQEKATKESASVAKVLKNVQQQKLTEEPVDQRSSQ